MCNVYVYQAALYCEPCGVDMLRWLTKPEGMDPNNESTWDSGAYPKGPYADGGGEADTPQHCDSCNRFLDNPLTDEGAAYVRDALRPYASADGWTRDSFADHVARNCEAAGRGVLSIWARRYAYVLEPLEPAD